MAEATTQTARDSVAAFAEAANETKIMRNIFVKKYTKNCDRAEVQQFRGIGSSESSFLAFVSASRFPLLIFVVFFCLCFVTIFSHVGHVYKMRRVLSIFITQTRSSSPRHTKPGCRLNPRLFFQQVLHKK